MKDWQHAHLLPSADNLVSSRQAASTSLLMVKRPLITSAFSEHMVNVAVTCWTLIYWVTGCICFLVAFPRALRIGIIISNLQMKLKAVIKDSGTRKVQDLGPRPKFTELERGEDGTRGLTAKPQFHGAQKKDMGKPISPPHISPGPRVPFRSSSAECHSSLWRSGSVMLQYGCPFTAIPFCQSIAKTSSSITEQPGPGGA